MSVSSRPDNILVIDDNSINGKRYFVFLDLMMPLMTGEELCQRLNAEPQLRVLHKIVLMSAADQLGHPKELGVDAVMRKPFAFEDVEEIGGVVYVGNNVLCPHFLIYIPVFTSKDEA